MYILTLEYTFDRMTSGPTHYLCEETTKNIKEMFFLKLWRKGFCLLN